MTEFVTAHIRAQRLQVDALSLKGTVERVVWELLEDIVTQDLGLEPRLADALYDAFFRCEVTNGIAGRSLMSQSQPPRTTLARLDGSGLMHAVGAGRARRYRATVNPLMRIASSAGLGTLPGSSPMDVQRSWLMRELAERVRRQR